MKGVYPSPFGLFQFVPVCQRTWIAALPSAHRCVFSSFVLRVPLFRCDKVFRCSSSLSTLLVEILAGGWILGLNIWRSGAFLLFRFPSPCASLPKCSGLRMDYCVHCHDGCLQIVFISVIIDLHHGFRLSLEHADGDDWLLLDFVNLDDQRPKRLQQTASKRRVH